MSYRDKTRKTLTLPSGATCVIRKLAARDFLSLGEIPMTMADPSKRPNNAPTAADKAWSAKLSIIILTKCCGPIELDGEALKIVDKDFGDAAKDEISIDEVEVKDSAEIINAVQEFSGFGKEAASTAKPFPEESKAPYDCSQAGEAVRPISLGSAELAA